MYIENNVFTCLGTHTLRLGQLVASERDYADRDIIPNHVEKLRLDRLKDPDGAEVTIVWGMVKELPSVDRFNASDLDNYTVHIIGGNHCIQSLKGSNILHDHSNRRTLFGRWFQHF